MAPKRAKQPKKEPALKGLHSFENSYHLTRVMKDALIAYSTKSKHESPGSSPSPDPDFIKIDARNGDGLLMDYDVSLNMKAELTMWQSYCGRPVEEVAYYMSLEQSPAGGLRLSHKQWINLMKGKQVKNLEKFPVHPETREATSEWLLGLNAKLSLSESTKTLVQDTLDARFGSRKEETEKGKGKEESGPRWEVWPLDCILLPD